MWDKETSKTKKPEETSVEGNTENSASRYFKRNNLYENVSAGTDTVVVATYVVNDDDDCADYRKNVTDRPKSLGTEQSDIDHLLSIVQLSDGPSTSSSSQKNELTNQVPYSTKLSDLKSVSPTSVSSISTAAKEMSNSEELAVVIDNHELPYKNTNTNIKSQSSMQSNKPVISVKFSPLSRKSTQNEKVPEQRCRNISSDNVAGLQMQSLHNKSLTLSAGDLDSATREYSPGSVEDLTSVSENRACSPSPSSVTSASTLRVARSSSGRRVECLRHMRRPPKEPEEYLDALFPHIRKAHNQIRQALLHAPLTDIKDNVLLKKKMLELIQIYTSGCKEEFERVGPSLVLCRRLKRNIIRLLDLFHEVCLSSREDHAYLYHISKLIAVYTSLEIRLSFNLTRLQKCALIHRISHTIHKHLMVKNESLAKENILRMFLHMPDTYSARFIMEPLFNTFLQEIPTSSNTWCQKELPDKVFVQYIIILHIWKEMLRDPLEQVELINRAQHFMCPTKTLHANPMYANHLPTIHTRKHAVKDILNSLKFFHDLRNAAICDDTLHDEDDDIEVVIDEVINIPFWDFGATYTGESKQQRNLNRRVITADPTECVDLTQEDDQQSINDTPLEWLTKLKERAAERVQCDESEKVICLDSDSDGELFCGSILDPSESYQDCDAVDTDYTSLDGSTTDDKELSEDEELSGNGITPNGLRTYLAPRTKNQINVTNDKRSTTYPPLVSDGEGDSAAVGPKKSAVATVTTAESTLPLIVNSFTVRGKQNMHLLNSPRFSLDIGPERLGNEDIEFHDTCNDESELSFNFKTTKNHIKRADSAVANEHTAKAPPSVGSYYEKEVDNDAAEEDEEYNSLPSTASSSTTTLGKVIYTQALLGPSQQFLKDYDEREENYDRTNCIEKNAVDNERSKIDNTKQMLMLCEDKPVKKQVKFNDNPIGPTRRPHTKMPIKPAIHLNKIQSNNQQPIFSNSPQPRFSSPSSSTSSTTESLKQMAQKGRNFVDIIKTHKHKKILKSSSTIIIDSDDDDIINVNTSANKKTNLVSTQPFQSKNTSKKGIQNEHLSNRMCKMQACDVSNSTTMILGPKDISSTNNIRNKSVDIMHITQDEERVKIDSIVHNNIGVVEVVKSVEREEQNSNVSTTTGPNVDSNAEYESHRSLASEKLSQKQTNQNAESTCEEEVFSAHTLAVITGSDICTSTSTDAFMQSTECSIHNLEQNSSNTESLEVVEGTQLAAKSIGSENVIANETFADKRTIVEATINKAATLGNDISNENISKKSICDEKDDLHDKDKRDVLQSLGGQCTNKEGDENMHGIEVSKTQELNKEGELLSEKLQESQEFFGTSNNNVIVKNVDAMQKNLISSEKINEEINCASSMNPEICTEINKMCIEKLEVLGETAEAIQPSLDKSLRETLSCSQEMLGETSGVIQPSLDKSSGEIQSCSRVASDKTEVQIIEITENYVQTTAITKNLAEKSDVIPISNTVTTEDSLTNGNFAEPTVFDLTDTSDPKVIIIDNTITLNQQSESKMVEKIVTTAEKLVLDEEAIHTLAENEINETQNTTKVALEMQGEFNSVTTNINIDKPTTQGTTTTVNVSETNIQTSIVVKSPELKEYTANLNEFQIITTEAEEIDSLNIDLEIINKSNVDKEKSASNQVEIRECLEAGPNNSDVKICMAQTESIEVPREIFTPAIATNDGLVYLVEAVKAVEALTFTKQITEYTVPAESNKNIQEKRDENETMRNVNNLLQSQPNLILTTDALMTPKTSEHATRKPIDILENSLGRTDACALVKTKTTESNNIYFSGDKSPKTNLERLAEAAVQKYGEHVADRGTSVATHIQTKANKLADITLGVENVVNKSSEMPTPHTEIIDVAAGADSINIESYRDINKISESETTTIESLNIESNIVKLQANEQQISTATIVDNIRISQPIDYDMHIYNLSDHIKSSTTSGDFKQVDISKSSAPTEEYEDFDNISKIENNSSSTVIATSKTESTFHSHFESFLSTLTTIEESRSEVKGQRRSPRTQKNYTNNEAGPNSENVKSVVSDKKVISHRIDKIKNILSKKGDDLAPTNMLSTQSLAEDSPSLSASSDSEFSNVGKVEIETRRRYSLRKAEQWKVVKNTSLRASPPASSAESMHTRKALNNTLTTTRCIKIRLARAKVPTMAERKEQQPISTEQADTNLASEFGDVSHRPVTRRLAAALNSSLQMVTENAVIEPIKQFARGRKSKSKLPTTVAENMPLKRKKCENVANALRQNEKVTESNTSKEIVRHDPAISSNLKQKRKHCALELSQKSQKSHSEPPDVATILQNRHISKMETISDDSTCLPEESASKRMKIRKRKHSMKNRDSKTASTMQNVGFTFETVFVKPTLKIKNSKSANSTSTKTNAVQQQSNEESKTLININNKECKHDEHVLVDDLSIEATIQKERVECDEIQEKPKTNVLSTVDTSQNSIKDTQLTVEHQLANNDNVLEQPSFRLTVEDPTQLNHEVSDEVVDNNINPDNSISLHKISTCDENIYLEENGNEASEELSNLESYLTQNKEEETELHKTTNTSFNETSAYIRESVLKTQDSVTPSIESTSTNESDNVSVLSLDENKKNSCIKTIDSEKANVESRDESGVAALEELEHKVNTVSKVFIRDSDSNAQDDAKDLKEGSSTCDLNEMVSGEDMRKVISDKEKILTTNTNMSVLAEDINTSCTVIRVHIGESAVNAQEGVTSFEEFAAADNTVDINVLELDKSDSGKAIKADRNADTPAPIVEETINKDNSETNNFIVDTLYITQKREDNVDESVATDVEKETVALFLDGEMEKQLMKISDLEKTRETSVSGFEIDINQSSTQTQNELETNTTQTTSKEIPLTNELASAPITFREDSDMLPGNNEAPLVDISNFTSLTLASKTVRNFRDVSEFLEEDSSIDLSNSHIQITDKSEYLNESESINTLKTNMEVDKLLEEYNHSALIIANANLKIPPAMQTPTDVRTPACSSVTFSFTASDSSSSFTNSCSCNTTSTINSATDLYKNEPTSFKVVQSQAQVVELLSNTSTTFQDLSLLDLEHDVIMGNDDLLSEFIPTSMMDTTTATSLEHNYAIKPLETAITNEYDLQSEANADNEDIPYTNNETQLQVPSLKVSIPIAYIKRFEEITCNRAKNWYLAEKPTTSKAALAALAKRNAQIKTDIVHILNTSSVSRHKQMVESTISESVESKQEITTTDSSGSQQLLTGDIWTPSPTLPLKKRRNISGVLEEDYSITTGMLSDDSDLITIISQESGSNESNKLSDMTNELNANKQIEFNNTSEVETATEQQTIADNQVTDYQTRTNYVEEYHTDTTNSINEAMQNEETNFENSVSAETTIKQQLMEEDEEINAVLSNNENESNCAINEKSIINQKKNDNSNSFETIVAEQQLTEELAHGQYETNDEIITETKQNIRENIVSVIENSRAKNEDVVREQNLVRDQENEVILQLGSEIQMSENPLTNEKDLDEGILREDQPSLDTNDIAPITQNITDERALQEEQHDQIINNIVPRAQNIADETALLEDQRNMVIYKTETDGTVTNMEFEEAVQRNDAQADTNEHQIADNNRAIAQENLDALEGTTPQHALVPAQQELAQNVECHTNDLKDAMATDLLDSAKKIGALEIPENDMPDLMTIQQIDSKENILLNFNDRANEVILSSYDDQFLVTVCLDDADTVSGFEATSNFFASKEYTENDFDIANDVIISTQDIKEESTEFMSNFNSPKNSPINLTKSLTIATNAVDLNTPMLKHNEFASESPHSLAPTNSTNFPLFTMPNNEIVPTDLNVNNMSQFTNCELNIDQEDRSDRKSIVELTQMDELSFGEHESHQLPRAIEQVDQLEYNNFEQSEIHASITDACNTDAFVRMNSALKISTNTAATKPIEHLEETHETPTPAIKICSSQKSKPMDTMEGNEIIAMPTILAQSQHLAKPSTLSPVLPLIKPTTTTMNTIFEKSNTIFSFADIEPETTSPQSSVNPNNFPITTTAGLTDNRATTSPTADDKSPVTFSSQSSASQLQTQTMRNNTKHARAPARVQIVTPQRKNREIAPKTSEESKTPNIIFTNTTSFCSSVQFEMNQVAATIPVSYPTTPPRYANLFEFEKYIQKLMTLIDVPGIIDSARNLYVDKEALAEAHAALLAQATQFDDEGNAISEPLLLKYHKDGTISILNDNDECIILTANMSKMVKSLSLALSILQEQQSPVLGIRARIHALLKQLTQTSATTKTAHVAPNINNPPVIPTAVVNPNNLVDSSHDNDISDMGGDMTQQVQPSLQVINANLQNLHLYATNWQHIEDNGLITQTIPNSQLEIADKEQFIDIEALPFAAVDGAHSYEQAVAFNFDEPAAMLSSNENTSAQRFESAFHATVERTGAANCNEGEQNRLVHWPHERPASKVSTSATHIPSFTDVEYEQNATTGDIDVNNDNNSHIVMFGHRDDTLIENCATVASSKAHANTEIASKLITTISPKGEKSKKIVYQTSVNNQHARTQTYQKSSAYCSPKKLATKRVEKVPKAHCNILPTSAAVTPQQHTPNRSHSKARSMPPSNVTVSRNSHTIHYRHLPQPATGHVNYKPSATLHYKQATTRQQQQQQTPRISSLPTHFVTSNANQLQQAMPHLSIDNIGNLPLYAQQYPQNSALSGGVGLLHNNNIRYLLATPHTRPRYTPASTALSNSSIAPLNVTTESHATLGQYPYQLQALQTQQNFSDNLKINELQLQSVMKNATHGDVIDSRGSTADADAVAAATTTNMLRSFRNAVRMANALPKTDTNPSLILNNEPHTTNEGASLTTQQQHQQHTQQQQIQFVPPASALIISSKQHKQEAALDCLRQELAKRDTHLQTELQLPIAAQQDSRSQPKVGRNQRMYATAMAPISPTKHQQHSAREMLNTCVNSSSHASSSAPTSPNQQSNASRKRGRPRKYNLGEDVLLGTSELLQPHGAGETVHKYVKLNESPKIRSNASDRHKLPLHKQTHAKVRQILPTTHHIRPNYKLNDLAAPQPIPPPPPLIKLTSRCTQQELRPSFTSSANAFHLIEHMVETISTQNAKSTATAQQQQAQQTSLLDIAQSHTTPHSQLDQNNHINAIATLFSSYKITKPALVSGATARNSDSNTALVNKSKYKAGPKSMHMSRKTTAMTGTRKNSTNTPQSPRSVSDTHSPTTRNHSISPVSLHANSPVIIAPETAADPKLNKKCAVIMKENDEVINYKRQQVAFINELLEKQREMQRQRALKRQEFQNILKQKREEGKRLMAEISQIKKRQAEAHETILETQIQQSQQSPTILNRKRLLVRERNVTFKTNTKVRSRSTTPNRTNSVQNNAESVETEVDTTRAAIMQSVIGDTIELATDAMPLSDGANRTFAALKNIKAAQAQDQKSTTSTRLTAGMGNEEANTITNSPITREQSTTSNPLNAAEKFNSSLQVRASSSDEKHTADALNKTIKTNAAARTSQLPKTTQKVEELTGTEIQGTVVPTTSKTSFSENPIIPALQALATTTPYTRCTRSMTPTRGVYETTKQSEMPTERTTDTLLVNCTLSSPTSSRTRLQRAPSLSPSIFMNRNRVEVRRSMQDPTSNTDFSANNTSWLLPESPRTVTKTLKVRLKRLQHLNMNATATSSPEKETSDKIAMSTLSRDREVVSVALAETPEFSTLEFQTKNNKQKHVQLLKQQLKKELLKMDENYIRPVDTKDEIERLQSSNDVACTQATQTVEGRISKVARRKPQRRPQQSNKKLRLLEKFIIERQTNKTQVDLRINDSTCDNADEHSDSKIPNAAQIDVEDDLQCDRNQEMKEIVGDTLAIDNNDVCHNSRQLLIEPSENVEKKAVVHHSENNAEQQELTSSNKHAIEDVLIANTHKESSTKNAMDIDCSNVSDKKHKRTHKHGAIVTQVVDVTPGRHVNDSLLGDLLLATTANNSAVLNDVLNTTPKLGVIKHAATELQIPDKVSEPTVDDKTFVKPNNSMPEGVNDRTHIEMTNEMAVAVSGLAMLANRPITTTTTTAATNTESCINAHEFQNENVDISTPKKASSESFASGMHCVADPTTVIGLLNGTQTHTIKSIDEHATIDEEKQEVVENRNDLVPLPNDTGCISDGEESSSDCLLSQLSKRVHKMSDLESIVEATTVHVIKDATMTLMSFEATPTLPAYLLNGESRDVPTPPAIATPAPTPAPTPTADLTLEAEQPKHAPTPPLPELMLKENTHTAIPIDAIIREELNKTNDSTDATVAAQEPEPAVEDMNSLAAEPQQAPQEQATIDERLPDNHLSPPMAQDQQLEEVNSPAPASAISASDHEVSSTQELVYTPTKRSNAITLNNAAGMSMSTPIDEEAAMLVQNSQIDTTHHLPESSYYMRKRARKFSDEFILCENKIENSTKDIMKKRRKTFSSESCLPAQFSTNNNTTFPKNNNELMNSSATASTSNVINNGGQNSGGSSPSTTTEPVTKQAPPRRRNHLQKRNNSQSPLTGRSRAGGSVGELNATFVYSCSRYQPTTVDMADMECCVVLPASAVVPPVNLGNIARTYSKNNLAQIKVFVPPDVEMCLENEDAEKDAIVATTTSKRGRSKGSATKTSRKQPKLESAEKVKAKKTATNITKTKTAQPSHKRDAPDGRPKPIDNCKPPKSSASTKAPTRAKNVERASNRKRK